MRPLLILLAALQGLAAAPMAAARQDDPRLDSLFSELQSLDKRRDQRAGELQAKIWYIWYEHDDARVNALMERGLKALALERYTEAVDAFSHVIDLDRSFAEAWNRRGTAYYLLGRYEDSLADIRHVLALEPRHFAALAGRGLCLRELGRPRAAIDAFKQALEINPHLDRVYVEILRLRAHAGVNEE